MPISIMYAPTPARDVKSACWRATQFADNYISLGADGGGPAADKLMDKTKEYLASLNPPIKDVKDNIMIKAYANLNGMAKVFKEKGIHPNEISAFWQSFTRRFPFVDFVDVGWGKEVADNKIRGKTCLFVNVGFIEKTRDSADQWNRTA